MLEQLKHLIQACRELNIQYSFKDRNKNVVEIDCNSGKINFVNTTTPFNSEAVARICRDKSFCYQILNPYINSPKTIDFLDPFTNEKFLKYTTSQSYTESSNQICKLLDLPLIIKPNTKAQGINVFKCTNYNQVLEAVEKIFNKNSADYDYVLLAQQYLDIDFEYRVIVFERQIVFVYLKDVAKAVFKGNLSPLHWEGSKAIFTQDKILITKLQKFIEPIFDQIDLVFGGLDIAVDKNGIFWLIEINTQPGFDKFLESNDQEHIVNMYKRMLNSNKRQ